jgi:hypothetical protein
MVLEVSLNEATDCVHALRNKKKISISAQGIEKKIRKFLERKIVKRKKEAIQD